MPKVKLHYVIINGCDGSAHVNFYADAKTAQLAADLEDLMEPLGENGPHEKTFDFDAKGRLLNPSSTKAELLQELAEMRGDDEGAGADVKAAPAFKAAAGKASFPFTATLHYVVRNGGDGSASAGFYADAATARLAADIEEEGGEAFQENPHSQGLKFNAKGLLLNPDATAAELREELADRGEEREYDDEITSVAGKKVVFTGKLSTMTRKQAEDAAEALGARAMDWVTRNTDILIVGENPGSKLIRAKELGTVILSEDEWNKLTPAQPAKRGPAPKPRP